MSDPMHDMSPSDGDRLHPLDGAWTLTARQIALRDAAGALIAEHHARPPSLTARLRSSIDDYTRKLRDEGAPPERVLTLVKTAVTPALSGPADERRELMDLVVHWCVEAYYAA